MTSVHPSADLSSPPPAYQQINPHAELPGVHTFEYYTLRDMFVKLANSSKIAWFNVKWLPPYLHSVPLSMWSSTGSGYRCCNEGRHAHPYAATGRAGYACCPSRYCAPDGLTAGGKRVQLGVSAGCAVPELSSYGFIRDECVPQFHHSIFFIYKANVLIIVKNGRSARARG